MMQLCLENYKVAKAYLRIGDNRIADWFEEKASQRSTYQYHRLFQHVPHTLGQVIKELLPRCVKFGRRPGEEEVWIAIIVVEFDRYATAKSA
jgi:hypothetical protein